MRVKTKLQESKKQGGSKIFLFYIMSQKHIPWDFSMRILRDVFHKTQQEAVDIATEIQSFGEAICGAYIYEIAETKAYIVEREANREGFSLQCLLEEV